MSDKFRTLMNAVDDDLLEEAMTVEKRKRPLPWIAAAVAACLLLVMGSMGNMTYLKNSEYPKVAACALLFGFARLDAFPIDVWIKKVMEKIIY